MSVCSVCAQSKSSHQPLAGLLYPLPVPSHPWSHIAWTSLLDCLLLTTILTITDCSSKTFPFAPLSKLPSADLLVLHVFQIHSIPEDIVSDQGLQFLAVWKAFCKALGATASLSTAYNPQSNDQTEQANQDLESALCCVTSCYPSSMD